MCDLTTARVMDVAATAYRGGAGLRWAARMLGITPVRAVEMMRTLRLGHTAHAMYLRDVGAPLRPGTPAATAADAEVALARLRLREAVAA